MPTHGSITMQAKVTRHLSAGAGVGFQEPCQCSLHLSHSFYIDTRTGLSPTRSSGNVELQTWARASTLGISRRRTYPESVLMDGGHEDPKQVYIQTRPLRTFSIIKPHTNNISLQPSPQNPQTLLRHTTHHEDFRHPRPRRHRFHQRRSRDGSLLRMGLGHSKRGQGMG